MLSGDWSSVVCSSDLSDDEKRDLLQLIRSEHLGPITFHHILLYLHGDAARAIAALPDMARRGGSRRAVKLAPLSAIDAQLKALRKLGASLLACSEPGYPLRLMQLHDAPPLLCAMGQQIGSAHVRTPVPNAPLVCRPLLGTHERQLYPVQAGQDNTQNR